MGKFCSLDELWRWVEFSGLDKLGRLGIVRSVEFSGLGKFGSLDELWRWVELSSLGTLGGLGKFWRSLEVRGFTEFCGSVEVWGFTELCGSVEVWGFAASGRSLGFGDAGTLSRVLLSFLN